VLSPNHLCSALGLVLSGLLCVATACFAQQGRWTPKADMPTPRWGLSTSAVAGTIYAIGGFERGSALRTVEAYDPKTNTWTKKADMPTPRSLLATSVVDGKIYAVGGGNLEPGQLGLPTVEEYDPMTDTWTTRVDMPTPRHALSTCVVDGKIYAISGFDGTNMATVEQYDPSSDTWTTKADLPTLRSHLVTQVVGGKIYAIGGWDRRDRLVTVFSSVAVYDPATDTWTKRADMPTPRSVAASSVVNGKIYVIGGTTVVGTGNGHTLQTVEVYDPETDTWTQEVDMPTARGWLSASLVDGKLYAIGGGLGSGLRTSLPMELATVEEFVALSPE
ncbi:hypothetical protein MYX82_11230, partial [Acidobacteria bacterium AH-259-D05]|nr:hypothetical protein [Acidobacteria bacterium AH-259-D05]